jgi:DNA-binding MarR family transcriptional regulator
LAGHEATDSARRTAADVRPAADLRVGEALVRVTTAVGERVLEVRDASGLTALQLQVLRIALDSPTMSDLVVTLAIPKSTATSVVDQLVETGMVRRARDARDGRRQVVRLTRAGRRKLFDFDAAVGIRIAELVAAVAPERRARLVELLAKIPNARRPLPLA